MLSGVLIFSLCNNSFIALPAPPVIVLSSIDINFLLVFAILIIKSSSSGLINLMSITVAPSSLPALIEGSSILPNAKIAISFPFLIMLAFPISITSSVLNSSI